MNTNFQNITHAAQRKMMEKLADVALSKINRDIDETDPHVAKMAVMNLGYEAFFRGTKTIRKNREKYHCNIPWLILFDPISACNMHCAGCWSGTYGHKHNLSFEDTDKIIAQGKKLGVYLYMLTGGEPLIRKQDILRLAEKLCKRAQSYNEGVALAQEYARQGKVLIVAPDDTCGVDTLKKDKESLQRLYQKGYSDGKRITDYLSTER